MVGEKEVDGGEESECLGLKGAATDLLENGEYGCGNKNKEEEHDDE